MTVITLIHNPRAGIQPIAAPILMSLLSRAGYQAHYVSVRRTANLAADLLRRRGLVVVAGGDGTVADVLRAGRNARLQVAILPSGVANNIASSFGISDALPAAVTDWRRSRPRPTHLAMLEVAGKQWLVVESIGLGALADAARTMPHRTTSSFARTGMLAQTRRHFRDVIAQAPRMTRLAIDGEEVGHRPIFAEILNIPMTGPNLRLTREATLSDGHLHIVYASEKHRQPLLDWLDNGAAPAAVPALPTLRAKAFAVDWEGGTLRIDDEMTNRSGGRLTVRCDRARISVLAPP